MCYLSKLHVTKRWAVCVSIAKFKKSHYHAILYQTNNPCKNKRNSLFPFRSAPNSPWQDGTPSHPLLRKVLRRNAATLDNHPRKLWWRIRRRKRGWGAHTASLHSICRKCWEMLPVRPVLFSSVQAGLLPILFCCCWCIFLWITIVWYCQCNNNNNNNNNAIYNLFLSK